MSATNECRPPHASASNMIDLLNYSCYRTISFLCSFMLNVSQITQPRRLTISIFTELYLQSPGSVYE